MPPAWDEAFKAFAQIPNLKAARDVPLASCTRFGLGGPARILADAYSPESLAAALRIAAAAGAPHTVIGAGANLVVSDKGYHGIVLRYPSASIQIKGERVAVDAGAELDRLVDLTVARGLGGLESLTGIPGWVGGAVYGNAGAYGHSISERVVAVHFLEDGQVRSFPAEQCEFRYRDSIFKRRKDWIILSTDLLLETSDADLLRRTSEEIRQVRDRKFPPTMRCAGSIFKNLLIEELPVTVARQTPESIVREGKAPAAWFLDQVGARGASRGGIRVADHHANLIFNAGGGTAAELRDLIEDLRRRVWERFGLRLEEEVQYLGF